MHNITQMPLAFNHIIGSSLCVSILTLYYWIFFQRNTHFKANRYFLLAIIGLSLSIPFISLDWSPSSLQSNSRDITYAPLYTLQTITLLGSQAETGVTSFISGLTGFKQIYLLGGLFFLLRLAHQLLSIRLFSLKFAYRKKKNIRLIFTTGTTAPFSFFNWLFINEDLLNTKNSELIIQHEKAHIKQWHSLDIMFLEFLFIFQWFNPFMWLLRKAIRENHEYLADEAVLSEGVSLSRYQETLLFQSMGTRFEIVHGFKKSVTLKRLKMMTQKQTSFPITKSFATIVLLFIMAWTFAGNNNSTQNQAGSSTPDQPVEASKPKSDTPDKWPTFPGGTIEMRKFLAKNIKYPKKAHEQNIQGKILIAFTISKKGKVTKVHVIKDPKGKNSKDGIQVVAYNNSQNQSPKENLSPEKSHPLLAKEAIRVIKSLPNWRPAEKDGKPVAAPMVVPINFHLQKSQEK